MCDLCANNFLRCAVMRSLCPTIFFGGFLGHMTRRLMRCCARSMSYQKFLLFWGHVTNLPMCCYARPMSYQNFPLFWRSRDQFAYALLWVTYVLPKIFPFLEVTWPNCLCAVMCDLCPTKNFSFFVGHVTNLPLHCYAQPMSYQNPFFGGHMTKLPMHCYAQPMSYQKFSLCSYAWTLSYQIFWSFLRSHDTVAYVLLCADSVLSTFLEFGLCHVPTYYTVSLISFVFLCMAVQKSHIKCTEKLLWSSRKILALLYVPCSRELWGTAICINFLWNIYVFCPFRALTAQT